MNDATLSRGHRGKGIGPSGGSDLLDGSFGGELEITVTSSFEAFGIEGNAVVIFGLKAQDLGSDVFDGVEEFAVAGQKEGGVRPSEFNLYIDVVPGSEIGGHNRGDAGGIG
jgi:hypothetical protein